MKLKFLSVLLLLNATFAFATLGGDESSVEHDREKILGVRHPSSTNPNYTLHEIANNRLTVREYFSSTDQKIFAIAWEGRHVPDLAGLLGKYADDYHAALRKNPPGPLHARGFSARAEGDEVIVEKFGHMGHMQGRAYLKNFLPVKVDLKEIR